MNGDGSRPSTASACGNTAADAVIVPRGMTHVVAGALIDAAGRVLLAQRPTGKHLAGYWEFPGGKVEPGETAAVALRRELREEIGVEIEASEPLIRVPWHYGTKSIFLDVYKVRAFRGEPISGEGQALRWVPLDGLDLRELPPADHPVVAALQLPQAYLITPEPEIVDGRFDNFLLRLHGALDRGIRLVQLRARRLPRETLRELAAAAHACVRAAGGKLLLNGDIELVRELQLDGVHLPSPQLIALRERPLPSIFLIGASCHNADELAAAARISADFAVLGTVQVTTSHPHEAPLGWDQFGALVATSAMPIYALGGIGPADLTRAVNSGAQGVAGISRFW